MQTGMEITRVDREGIPELLVSGRMDSYWSRHLEESINELMREGIHRIRLNLAQTAYISSAGIRVLIQASRQFSAVGGALQVVEPSPSIQKVLSLAGLGQMFMAPAGPAKSEAGSAPIKHFEEGECSFDIYDCHPGALLACRVAGLPERLGSASFSQDDARPITLQTGMFALGLGAFGDSYEVCSDRFGEFIALAGCAAAQPAEEPSSADYLVHSENFIPRVLTLYHLCCRGDFDKLIRFESNPSSGSVQFGKTIAACMSAAATTAAGIVLVAESAGLLGASLKRSPTNNSPLFHYPEIRQWLSFSPVRTYTRSVVVIAGVAVQSPAPSPIDALLRPITADSSLLGHFHAAAFGYHPLRKGYVELEPLVKRLFDTGGLQGVLHLLSDARAGSGAGDSEFTRGACWIGPIGQFLSAEENL
jgi:anti-anti-sigma factor